MNVGRIQALSRHPAEDAFTAPLHTIDQERRTNALLDAGRPDTKPFVDTSGWNEPMLPTYIMANDGKPRRVQLARQPEIIGGLRIYLAGPMSGIKNFNFPAFDAAARLLESHGHEVFNPAERDRQRHGGIDISLGNEDGDPAQAVRDHGFSLRDALRDDTHYICTRANAIAMLPGWEGSNGAQAEHRLAFKLGHVRIYLGGFYG